MMNQSIPIKEQTRRERRIERQRRTIMDAAADLFAQKGYRATTTRDIAEAVDIGESTIYGYFSGKKEVLEAILSRQAEMVDALLVHLVELEDPQSFVNLVDLLMEKILTRTVYNRVLIAEAWTDDEVLQSYVVAHWQPVLQTLQNFISMKIAKGNFKPIDPGIGARMVVGSFFAAILPVLRGVEPAPTPEQRHQLAMMIVETISNGLNIKRGWG
ncbi:MAG: TetR/AcrR family transcriptional regulator [Anaerolineales bacterium]|jgi:AcrR family transcriptional regulator